jgi:hypothetical protein
VALLSALGLFHVSWEDMEDIYTDLKTDSELKNNVEVSNNKNSDKNGKQMLIVSTDINSQNDYTKNDENNNDGNTVVSADLGPDSSLVLSFSRAAERCLPELSHAETFQVGVWCSCLHAHVCVCGVGGCMGLGGGWVAAFVVWVYGCMGVCVYGCMGVWVYGCMGVCVYGCMCVWVYGCMGVCVYGCMCVWVYVCMGVWVYVCMCVWVYVCMGVWVYV